MSEREYFNMNNAAFVGKNKKKMQVNTIRFSTTALNNVIQFRLPSMNLMIGNLFNKMKMIFCLILLSIGVLQFYESVVIEADSP